MTDLLLVSCIYALLLGVDLEQEDVEIVENHLVPEVPGCMYLGCTTCLTLRV